MKNNLILKVVSAIVVVGSSTAWANKSVDSVPGEFIVKVKDSQAFSHLSKLGESRWVSKKNNIALVKRSAPELQSYSLETLNSDPSIEYAEPNYIYTRQQAPNDPEYGKLWGLANFGQKDSGGASGIDGVDVDAERAWDIQTGNQDLVIAVIDTGVDYTLDDLKENIWTNEAEANGQAGVDDDGNGYIDDIHGYDFANNDADPKDDHGHGSHVSGTIAAKGNDGHGLVGVAWNAKIMGVKFLSAAGSGSLEGAIKAIDYATTMGAKIMNNSWGGGGYSKALEEAIQRSSDAGALFVAAAGNSSQNNDAQPTYPATYDVPNVISVAAIDNKGELARFSCYGKTTVDVAAPGVNILSSTPGGYKSWSGTSMATPHVAGVAALLLSNEPTLTAPEVIDRLKRTAKPLAGLRNKVASSGAVNAYFALTNQEAPADPNDPGNWQKVDFSIETTHPYKDKAKESWTIKVDGAKRIAIHFERFETEKSYDKVTVTGSSKGEVDVMSGDNSEIYSAIIEGDTAVLTFESDDSVNGWGFKVDHIAFE
ncbi:MAG: S8 family serine peptidase [Bdellovibrionales bacterium]|nr:S8 family serine peptidase [Bdellovibrionales bacterium]